MAGMHKHKWSYTVKYAPDHFGRNAFSPPNRVVTRRWLNVSDLEAVSGKSSDVDLSALGYDKLLGNGEVKRAVNVTISRASASAIEKVKAAGGSVKLDSKEPLEKEKRASETPSSEQSSKNSKERVRK
jgi:large subunit ribosomal protein L15